MSIYESISPRKMLKRPFRIFSNAYNAFVSGKKTGKPFKIKFESSAVCNLKCVMCPLTKGLTRKQGFLKFENFKKVHDELRAPYINLTGLGEPLLNPDLFKIISYAKKTGSIVKLDSNATLLTEENIKKLLSCSPDFISVSIDGLTKKSYESIRVGANFEKVISNLKALIKKRNELKSQTKIHVFFVMQQNNFKELPGFLRFIDSLGVDAINGNIAISFGNAKNEDKLKMSESEIKALKEELSHTKTSIKTKLNIENIEDFLNKKNMKESMKEKPCFYPWYNPCITWDGFVVPCDIHCNNEIVFGNAFQQPFMKIWNSSQAQAFRKQLIKERKGICATCCVDESFILEKLKPLYRFPLTKMLSKRKLP